MADHIRAHRAEPQSALARAVFRMAQGGLRFREDRGSFQTNWENLLPALFKEHLRSLKGPLGLGVSTLSQLIARGVRSLPRLQVDDVKGVFTFGPVLSFPDIEKAVLPFLVKRLQKVFPNLRGFSPEDMSQKVLSRYREDRVLKFLSDQVTSMLRARYSGLSGFPELMNLTREVKGVEWDAPFVDTVTRVFTSLLPEALQAHKGALGDLTPAMVRDYLVEFRTFTAPPQFLKFLDQSGLFREVWYHSEVVKLRASPGFYARELSSRYEEAMAALKTVLTQQVTLDALSKTFVAKYPKVIQKSFYLGPGENSGDGNGEGVQEGVLHLAAATVHVREGENRSGEEQGSKGEGKVPFPVAPTDNSSFQDWFGGDASFSRALLFKVDKQTGEVVDYEGVTEVSPRKVFALIEARHRDTSSPFYYEAIPCFNSDVWEFLERYAMARVLVRERTLPPALRVSSSPKGPPSEG